VLEQEAIPTLHGTVTFTIVFTTARQLPPSSARWIQSTVFHPIHFNIISHLRVSSKWSHSFRLPHQNPTWIAVLPHICHMPHPAQPPW